LITFLSKVKYTIGNAIVIVTYEITYKLIKSLIWLCLTVCCLYL